MLIFYHRISMHYIKNVKYFSLYVKYFIHCVNNIYLCVDYY